MIHRPSGVVGSHAPSIMAEMSSSCTCKTTRTQSTPMIGRVWEKRQVKCRSATACDFSRATNTAQQGSQRGRGETREPSSGKQSRKLSLSWGSSLRLLILSRSSCCVPLHPSAYAAQAARNRTRTIYLLQNEVSDIRISLVKTLLVL